MTRSGQHNFRDSRPRPTTDFIMRLCLEGCKALGLIYTNILPSIT